MSDQQARPNVWEIAEMAKRMLGAPSSGIGDNGSLYEACIAIGELVQWIRVLEARSDPDDTVLGRALGDLERSNPEVARAADKLDRVSREIGERNRVERRASECARLVDEYLPKMREAARSVGYALAVHGSLSRDVDIVAVPWIEDAATPQALVDAVTATLGVQGTDWGFGYAVGNPDPCTARPHGRFSWAITLVNITDAYFDLSVISPRNKDHD